MKSVKNSLVFLASLPLMALSSSAYADIKATHTSPVIIHLENDSPGFSFTDENGKYYYHDTLSQYSPYSDDNSDHAWRFFSGKNYSDVDALFKNNSDTYDQVKAIYDPAAVQNTVSLCINTPLMKEIRPRGTDRFEYINYCGLMDVWVDPDTGYWYGLLHNEIFGMDPRYDAIDLALSTDKGRTWEITSTLQTSQYGTLDSRDFQLGQTYNYGGGDPRLFVDYSTGYFYMFYTSRVQNRWGAPSGFNSFMQAHVMRAPISEKMAAGSWQKFHEGVWKTFEGTDLRLGHNGPVSNIVPVEMDPKGYFTPEYSPDMQGSTYDMRERGDLINSPLRVTNVSWNSYLGKYIATPEHRSGEDDDQSAPLPFYVTDNLSGQKWTKLVELPDYANGSWYRFMMDPEVEAQSNFITGKTFRTFCYIACTDSHGEYIDVTFHGREEKAFDPVINAFRNAAGDTLYLDGSGVLALASRGESPQDKGVWTFIDSNDGYYQIARLLEGGKIGYLGISPAAPGLENYRRWGARVGLLTNVCRDDRSSEACLSTQWVLQPEKVASNGGNEVETGFYRLINRLSGLALSFSTDGMVQDPVAVAPLRTWDCVGDACLDPRKVASQRMAFR